MLASSVTPGNPPLAQVQATMSKRGALRSVAFKSIGLGGADIYSVRFEQGGVETRIWLRLDRKIEAVNVRPELP